MISVQISAWVLLAQACFPPFQHTCDSCSFVFESNEKIYNRFEINNELATQDALAQWMIERVDFGWTDVRIF